MSNIKWILWNLLYKEFPSLSVTSYRYSRVHGKGQWSVGIGERNFNTYIYFSRQDLLSYSQDIITDHTRESIDKVHSQHEFYLVDPSLVGYINRLVEEREKQNDV